MRHPQAGKVLEGRRRIWEAMEAASRMANAEVDRAVQEALTFPLEDYIKEREQAWERFFYLKCRTDLTDDEVKEWYNLSLIYGFDS